MAIPETQLDSWSKQGYVTQSQQTYASIRGVLDSADAPYRGRSFNIFLQGSYGNDTNIYADSDVDVVIALTSTYYDDTSGLSEEEKVLYREAFSPASYSYFQFKAEVLAHLRSKFGVGVVGGKKAIFVPGTSSRRDADVLAAAQYRKYTSYRSWLQQSYVEGICFWTSDGTQIINYPKQHSQNLTTRHQSTLMWLKPTVRIFKNMRNRMISEGYLAGDVAPSYFIEGMLYNVPSNMFGMSYSQSFQNCLRWLDGQDETKLVCANEQYYLVHPTSPVTWRSEKYRKLLSAAASFWRDFS